MRCDRKGCPVPSICRTLCCLQLAYLIAFVLSVAPASGEEGQPEKPAPEEPKTLLSPVELLPVEGTVKLDPSENVTPAAAPPVKLAPELLPQRLKPSAKIVNTVEGIRPASFKEITPGESTRDQLIEKLGKPVAVTTKEEAETLSYAIGPFPTVDFILHDNVISSIVIHLGAPTLRTEVAKELSLEDFRPVVVRDDADRSLGEVYPERALMFAYDVSPKGDEEVKVSHVILETITVEPFLLRAEQDPPEHFSRRLADLLAAQTLAPDSAEAFALAAKIDQQCGRPLSALEAARRAIELDGDRVAYQLTLADVKRQLGQYDESLSVARSVLRNADLTSLERAEASLLYGKILATMSPRDYKQAMQETVAAIKLAAAQTGSTDPELRRQARQLLIDGELSLAETLSYGPWKQKHQVVPQWLASAEKAANEFVEKDQGSRRVLLSVYTTSLHCLLILEGQGSPDNIADAAIQLGRELIAEAEDEDYRCQVEWQLGTGLWYAAQVAHGQEKPADALRFANNADALLAEAGKPRSESPETSHHIGQLHFLIGSIYALQKKDNTSAIQWYEKALPRLQESFPGSLVDERGQLGEQMVSIGVSLWETGRKKRALSVTEEGAGWMQQAVEDGTLAKSALSVPYLNLATMHRQLGNKEQAELLAEKAAEIEPNQKNAKKRR